MPIGVGLFLQRKGIGAGGGGHTVEAEWADVHVLSHGRDRATKGLRDDGAGFFAGGDEGVALGDAGEEGGDVGGGDHLQKGVGGVVAEAADFGGGVVEGESGLGAKRAYRSLVEPLLSRHAKMQLVPEMNQPHNPPEVVDPVGVVERHAPAMWLGRETAEEQDACSGRQERLERVLFGIHGSAKITGIGGIDKKVVVFYKINTDISKSWQALPKLGGAGWRVYLCKKKNNERVARS